MRSLYIRYSGGLLKQTLNIVNTAGTGKRFHVRPEACGLVGLREFRVRNKLSGIPRLLSGTAMSSGSTKGQPSFARNRCLRYLCTLTDQSFNSSTIDDTEVKKFSDIAQHWWDEAGEFAALHTLNGLRIPLIRDALITSDRADTGDHNHGIVPKPLVGKTVLDVGCGGGILSEPLARLGARMTGIDAGEENILAAREHAQLDLSVHENVEYMCISVEELAAQGHEFDGVVASEILEHVTDPDMFISSCCQLVKPGGSLFITTLNKTLLSRALAVTAAEKIFRIVPDGAHDWDKFVTPEDLKVILTKYGLSTRLIHGMLLNPVSLHWRWISDASMNYALHAVKPVQESSSRANSDSSSSDDKD